MKTREQEIHDEVNWRQSTHNEVFTNSGAQFLIDLAEEYLNIKKSSAASSSSNASSSASAATSEVFSISVDGNKAAVQNIKSEIARYLNRAGSRLKPDTKVWLQNQLKAGVVLDRIILTQKKDGHQVSTEWCLPMPEVFVTIFKALIDKRESVWPVPANSSPERERLLRLRAFDQDNNMLAQSKKLICSTGVRHLWLQNLDGYKNKHLPLNSEDLLFQSLRSFVTRALHEHLGISLPDGKDPTGKELVVFNHVFKTIFLPWLLDEQMPEAVLQALQSAGGAMAVEQYILDAFEQIGVVPDAKMSQKIKNYSAKEALITTPCDFTPFLATLRSMLKKHADWLLRYHDALGQSTKDRLTSQIVSWLNSEAFSLNPRLSAETSSAHLYSQKHDDMQTGYLLARLLDALDTFQKKKTLLAVADITADKKAAWVDVWDYFERLIKEPSLEQLLQDDTLEDRLKIFDAECKAWQQNSYSDFITNFFVDWFAADNSTNIATRGKLFTTLSEFYFHEQHSKDRTTPVIYLSDSLLHDWTAQANEEGLLHLEVYQVNRILLHAISYPPSTWTILFREYLGILLAFIRTGFNEPNGRLKLDLLRDSYPEVLLKQIDTQIAQYNTDHPEKVTVDDSLPTNPTILTACLISSDNTSILATRYLLNSSEISEQLIQQVLSCPGFNIKACNYAGSTPLHLAALYGNDTIASVLIKLGADINVRSASQFTPLDYALWKGHIDIVKRLAKLIPEDQRLDAIKDNIGEIDNPDSLKTILQLLPKAQRLDAVRMPNMFGSTMLQLVRVADKHGQTVLHRVANKPESLKIILELIPEDQRLEALMLANKSGRGTLLQIVAKKPESLREVLGLIPKDQLLDTPMLAHKYGTTLLHQATDHPDSLKAILEIYPENQRLNVMMIPNQYGNKILHREAFRPNFLKLLLEHLPEDQRLDALMLTNTTNGQTALFTAASNPESLKVILELISTDQLLNAPILAQQYGTTLLHAVASDPESLKAILEIYSAGPRLEVLMLADKSGQTVLHKAAANYDSLTLILGLIPQDQKLNAVMTTDSSGQTVLHEVATDYDSLKEILEIIPKNQRLNAVMKTDSSGQTVLHEAVPDEDSLKLILELIPEDQRLNAIMKTDALGQTVLHEAARFSVDSLKIILELIPENQRLQAVMMKNEGRMVLDEPGCQQIIQTLIPQLTANNGLGLSPPVAGTSAHSSSFFARSSAAQAPTSPQNTSENNTTKPTERNMPDNVEYEDDPIGQDRLNLNN